jgi:hypothetical protein
MPYAAAKSNGNQPPDLSHQEAHNNPHDNRHHGSKHGPLNASRFFVNSVDRRRARVMEKTEEHQIHPG